MGNSRQMSVGPEAVAALLLAHAFEKVNPEDVVGLAHLFAFIVCISLWQICNFTWTDASTSYLT